MLDDDLSYGWQQPAKLLRSVRIRTFFAQ